MKKQSGFTLIELLVVIAIISLLASIVLASLNLARKKAADAAVKSDLVNLRTQAAMYYEDNNQSYVGFCASGVADMVISAAQRVTGQNWVCGDSVDAWAASAATLFEGDGGFWCVDSTGASHWHPTILGWDYTGTDDFGVLPPQSNTVCPN